MILFGKNITSNNDALVKMPVANIWHALCNPKPETQAHIRQLRLVRSIDPNRYNVLKRQLPYMVCGVFSPPFRRSENFAYIEYFILDIDHVSDKELSVSELKHRVTQDNRVVLCFVSPGEDGLKIMFKLSERCYDKGLFSLFYKSFAEQFARQYQIEQIIDRKTCDVTRACFISYDAEAYFNGQAETVDIGAFVPQGSAVEIFDFKHEIEEREKEYLKQAPQHNEPKQEVDAEIMRNIKAILNPNAVRKAEKNIIVPDELNEVIDDLRKYIEQTGVVVSDISNINYGKKIRMKMSFKQAEINLFYSPNRNGFKVVKSPRTGTDNEFNELMAGVVQSFIDTQLV